jgi:hypothetical protein
MTQTSNARILITDGGPHPADKWAVVTAEHIFQIGPGVTGDKMLAAKKFQITIAEILMPHHQGVQDDAQVSLKADAVAHMATAYDPLAKAQAACAAIVSAAAATPWAEHFAKPEVQQAVIQEIGNHFATAEHIERSWHADRNPDTDAAKAFRAKHNPAPTA